MLNNIICAGVGGQGVLTLGMVIADSAASQGNYVTWVPEYEGTMRGGASCTKVRISDEEIISPLIFSIDFLIALHENALLPYVGDVKDDGLIVVEESLVPDLSSCGDKKVLKVPCVELAAGVGNERGMSLVAAGAFLAYTGLYDYETGQKAVESYFVDHGLPVEPNQACFKAGWDFIKG